jgi:flagellar biosynthetic protein FliO
MEAVSSIDLIGTGIKSAAMLMVVLGILFAVLWAAKRFMLPNRGSQNGLPINLESSLYLSPKQRIAVVAVGGDTLVLGITPERINLLTKMSASLKASDSSDSSDSTKEQEHAE